MNKEYKQNYSGDDFEVRYSFVSLVIGESLISIVTILYLFLIIEKGFQIDILMVTLFFIMVQFFMYIWFKSFRIKVKEGVLRYSQLFGKTKEIRIEDIKEAYTEIGIKRPEDTNKAFMRLIIKPKEDSGVEEFYINIKPFDENGIRKLFELLPMRKGSHRTTVIDWERLIKGDK